MGLDRREIASRSPDQQDSKATALAPADDFRRGSDSSKAHTDPTIDVASLQRRPRIDSPTTIYRPRRPQ
jgi:hypothetical protein